MVFRFGRFVPDNSYMLSHHPFRCLPQLLFHWTIPLRQILEKPDWVRLMWPYNCKTLLLIMDVIGTGVIILRHSFIVMWSEILRLIMNLKMWFGRVQLYCKVSRSSWRIQDHRGRLRVYKCGRFWIWYDMGRVLMLRGLCSFWMLPIPTQFYIWQMPYHRW